MIHWIQKTFHTDKWWGKAIFMLLTYAIYWCLFYFSIRFFPDYFFDGKRSYSNLMAFYAVCLIPGLSLFLIKLYKKVFSIKPIILYISHFLFILSLLCVSYLILAIIAISNIHLNL